MKQTCIAIAAILIASLTHASAAPGVEALFCQRSQDVETMVNGKLTPSKIKVLDIVGTPSTSATSPDGSKKLHGAAKGKNGFQIVETKKGGKTRAVHSPDKEYDCDSVIDDDAQIPSTVYWLGNDVVFARGNYCSEFDSKPYLADAKTGKHLGFVALKVTPETVYRFASVSPSEWAISVWDSNNSSNLVIVVEARTGKIKSTTKATPAMVAKLPVCPAS